MEKKVSKDFSAQMIKLNSLVKIGQDALKAEQEMVQKLKSELESAKVIYFLFLSMVLYCLI